MTTREKALEDALSVCREARAALEQENRNIRRDLESASAAWDACAKGCGVQSELAALRSEQARLTGYVQHSPTCARRNNGQRWEPNYAYQHRKWWGAWIPDAKASYDCTCGLLSPGRPEQP